MTAKQIERAKSDAFYGGVLSALCVLNCWGVGTEYEEIVRSVNKRELVLFAKRNREYRSSGLAEAIRNLRSVERANHVG